MFPNLSETLSLSCIGRDISLVKVEVGIRKGLPLFQILGLASQNTKESKDRLRIALEASGFVFPFDTIIVNLHPNHKPKKVSFFDLAISIALLEASGQWQNPFKERIVALGSISLSGQVHASDELRELLWAFPRSEDMIFLVPRELREKQMPEGRYLFLDHLSEIPNLPSLPEATQFTFPEEREASNSWEVVSLSASQMKAFQGLAYGVLGKHHSIMVGNPGTGKTKLAHLVSQIQPRWSKNDFECKKESSVHTHLTHEDKLLPRPFRHPHHTTTEQALVGGGGMLTPGEVTLAHGGILFLDELTLFKDKAIESLREPMEEKKIEHARVYKRESLSADCIIIGAINPCPCGNYLGSKVCQCSKKQIREYLKKLSGPFLDRITIHIHLFANDEKRNVSISRNHFKERMNKAREFQEQREHSNITSKECFDQCENVLSELDVNQFSDRQKQNRMRLARTIADFDLSPIVKEQHLLEAYEFVQNSLFFEEIK